MADPGSTPAAHPDLGPLGPHLVVERLLGVGATATVYLARDTALDIPVTIKLLRPQLAASAEGRARFEREARAAANVVHANVPAVHRFGVLPDGVPYLVVRYVRGRTLEDRLAAEGPIEPTEARRILRDVASALDAAHREGVVHRDVRPANVLLEATTGRAMLTDFGAAAITEAWSHGGSSHITRTGEVLGDPRYVSPEQYRGEPVTDASDVFSLGVVGFEMVTGNRPFADAGPRASAVARMTAQPIDMPPAIAEADPRLADILRRCFAPQPSRRPSASTLVRWLDATSPDEIDDWWTRTAHALRKGRVPQWIAGTAAAGWLLLQAVDQLIQNALLPAAAYRIALATSIAALAAAAVLAWFHGERGEQRFRGIEFLLLGVIAVIWLAALLSALT